MWPTLANKVLFTKGLFFASASEKIRFHLVRDIKSPIPPWKASSGKSKLCPTMGCRDPIRSC
jgi:hypothetical protein